MKLDYILDCCQGQLEPKFEDLLKRALKSTERLTGILQGMYTYAKLGAQSGQMGEVNLAELVDSVVADLHYDDALNINIGIGELPVVWGNSQLLARVFINLINNAVKYNDKQQININITCNQIQEGGLGKFCRICVEDNGRGISEGDRPRIFSLFFRGGDADRSGEGIGLGLSFVQRIVELHFGRIEVESEHGKGTKFLFTLPMEEINFVR
jgi:signal transduction histidine kinase